MAIILVSIVVVLCLAILDYTRQGIVVTSSRVNDQDSTRIAEAGIEKVVWCLNNPTVTAPDCPRDASGNYTGETDVALGNGKYTTSWDKSTNTIVVTSTVASKTKQVRAKLSPSGIGIAFNYGLQVGIGGIEMANSAQINGNVYANGSVIGVNSAKINGDIVLAVGDSAANAKAEPDPYTTMNFGAGMVQFVVQSFVPTMTDKVYEIDLKVARTSTPPNNFDVMIFSDSGSNNPGAQLTGAKVTVPATTPPVNTPGAWESPWTEINFTPNTELTAGTRYWLVLKFASSNPNRYYTVLSADGVESYANGHARYGVSPASGLVDLGCPSCDIAFRVNMGGTFPTLNMNGGVVGSAWAHTIDSTDIGGDAYYKEILNTVRANTSGTPEPCEMTSGTHCHVVESEQPPSGFPLTSAQIHEMELGAGTTEVGSQTITTGLTELGPVIINGDLTLTNDAEVRLTGTIWVKGNISLSQTSKIVLANAYGNNSGIIIAHDPDNPTTKGKITFNNASNVLGNNNPKTYIIFIAMSDDLVNPAVSIGNSLTAPIIYVPYGLAALSNSPHLKELVARKISMANTATIDYEIGLMSPLFTSGPGASWTYQKGSYQIL